MSSITIKSNLASLGTQRRLGETTAELGRSFERLSSGLRINRASDDAAGLAISTSLSTDNRVFNQGIRNLNDGLSLLNVADGALSELSGIVIRIRELTEQSANGTLSNTQRDALEQEAQELSEEYTRIAQTTEVNGLKLFDGSLEELSLQAGYGENGAVTSSLGGAIGDGTFATDVSYFVGNQPNNVDVGDFNNDGTLDILTSIESDDRIGVLIGNGDGTFGTVTSYQSGVGPGEVIAADINGDGNLDIVAQDGTLLLGQGDGNFASISSFTSSIGLIDLGDINNDGVLDILEVDEASFTNIHLGNGDGSFQSPISFASGANARDASLADLNADGNLDFVFASFTDNALYVHFGNGDGTFGAASSYAAESGTFSVAVGDYNNDGILDLASADRFANSGSVLFGAGDGTFNSAISYSVGSSPDTVVSADVNGDGSPDLLLAGGGQFKVLINQGDGTFQDVITYALGTFPDGIAIGDFNEDGALDTVVAVTGEDTVNVFLANTTSGVGPLLPFSLSTKADALQAMAPLDRKIEQLASQKGTIGAFQSRVETAINNLQITSTNVKAAESRIAGIDTATESARLARLNILQQAGASVLAQANIQPQIALRLLET